MNPEMSADFFVATDGDDGNCGSADKPFATVARARDAVREKIAAGLDKDVLVLIRGGTYPIDRTIAFGPEDSGTAEHSVTYAAAPQERDKVLITGGRRITGWTACDGPGCYWQTHVPEVQAGQWWFRQLWADGLRCRRGRYPQHDLLTVTGLSEDLTELQFDRELPEITPEDRDIELVVLQNFSVSRVPVVWAKGSALKAAMAPGWVPHGSTTVRVNCRAYLEHARDFVRLPFEWHLDRAGGTLYCKAAESQDLNDREIVAPAVDQLLRVEGTADRPVRNLHFRGIELAHASWQLPEIGYSGIQACHYGPGYKTKATYCLPAAVQLFYAAGCSLVECRLSHTGASGIALGAGCRDNRIDRCVLDDIGGNGLTLGWRQIADTPPDRWMDADWDDPRDVPTGNTITRCRISRCGAQNTGGVGVCVAFCEKTGIDHNLVRDMPYSGMSIGFRWNPLPTSQRECVVEYNHIHHVMQSMADGGGIYTLGLQPGSVLRGNLIHDIGRSEYSQVGAPNNGIFMDEGSTEFLVADNVIYNAPEGCVRFNDSAADRHTWVNNSFGPRPGEPDFPADRAAKAGPDTPADR